jgi:segregation and condensation protein B
MRLAFCDPGRLLGSVFSPHAYPCASGAWEQGLLGGEKHHNNPLLWVVHRTKESSRRQNDAVTRLEAVFFLSQQPQTSRKLAQLAGLADGTKARTLVRTLNRRYDAEGSAFRIEEVAGGFQLMTRPKFAPWLRRLQPASTEVRLSAPAVETLAVVAYRQPVLRTEIEAIRGVQSGEVLRQLIERGLVRIAGRSEELGRPFLYGTTKQFLQVFGLKNLEELPRADVLRMEPSQALGESSSENDHSNLFNPSQVAEEETNVKTLIRTQARQDSLTEGSIATLTRPNADDRVDSLNVFAKKDEDEEDEDVEDEDEDEDDDFEDDDEPWEEVDDEDDDLDDDEDEDWEDDEEFEDDEDFDDEDDDWDDDEDEDEEEDDE